MNTTTSLAPAPAMQTPIGRRARPGACGNTIDCRPRAPAVAVNGHAGHAVVREPGAGAGMLLHRVRLAADGGGWRVAECDVRAPIEWHFHSDGPVARAPARLLAAAFGAGVAIRGEAGHA
jgi:hypothetical protein